MISVTPLLARLQQCIRKRPYISLSIGALLVVSTVSAVVFAADSNNAASKPNTGDTTVTQKTSDASEQAQAPTGTVDPAGTPKPATTTNAKTGQSTVKAVQPSSAPVAQKQLIVSPAAVSVYAGESVSGLTLRTNDNQAINMPGLSSMPAGAQVFLNFPAGPAKQTWSGSIGVMRTTKPGVYTVELFGQSDRATYYRGSLKVTVLPTPMMSVSVQQTGYDASQDAMVFNVRIERLYGYSKPIQSWYGQTWNSGVPLQLECPMYPVDDNNMTMYCRHVNGPRPTSGTISVNINVVGDSFNATAPFNLPPL